MKKISALIFLFFVLFFSSRYLSSKTFASCNYPNKNYDCNKVINTGINIAANISLKNLQDIRKQYPDNSVIQITVALTDQTLADKNKTDEFLNMLTDNGFLPTIRIYGIPEAKDSGKIAADLSQALKAHGLTNIPVEFGNEPNLEYPGGTVQQKATNYANAFVNFAKNCTNCQVFLPALGGTSLDNKELFANTFLNVLKTNPQVAENISGIIFNSYADTGLGAITDWLNTLQVWKDAAQQAGVSLDFNSFTYFLTEVGPPGAEYNSANLLDFVKNVIDEFNKLKNDSNYCQQALGNQCKDFQKLSGFSFFIWDPKTGDLYLLTTDENGNLVLKKQTKVNQPSTTDPSLSFSPDTPVTAFAHPPAESIQLCPDDDFPVPPASQKAPKANVTTTPPAIPGVLIPTPQLRENAKLRFGQPVKVRSNYVSKLCAQKQGEPIILEEAAYYNILDKGCIERPWTGEMTVSGMKIPFAQAIADHWAGTMDTEHLSSYQYDQLMEDAQKLGVVGEKARNEINMRTGVIKKLLPQQSLDKLKCDFVKYVFKRSFRKSTQYQYYMPDGKTFLTKFASIPPGCRNQVCLEEKDGNKKAQCLAEWDEKWGDAWSKMPVFPNEEAKGQLKFMVCGNKQYILNTAVPEVFRLGLAANTLQQSMTSKEKMDLLYNIYPELKDPLSDDAFVQNNDSAKTLAQQPKTKPQTFWEKIEKKIPLLSAITKSVEETTPKIRSVLAQAQVIYKNPSRLLAQVNTNNPKKTPDFSVTRTINCELRGDKIHVEMGIARNGVQQDHSRTDLYMDGKKVESPRNVFVFDDGATDDPEHQVDIPLTPGKTKYSFNSVIKVGVKEELQRGNCPNIDVTEDDHDFDCIIDISKGITKNQSVATKTFYELPKNSMEDNCQLVGPDGQLATGGPSCSNGSNCNFDISITPPPKQPDTQVLLWNKGSYKPQGKFTIGAKFNIQNNPDENSQEYQNCLKDPNACEKLATNEREIGVYNNVPMLVTAWLQAADKIKLNATTTLEGFLNNYKPWGLEGTTGISPFDLGNFCSSDQKVVLDDKGNYKKVDAVSKVTYNFRQTSGNGSFTPTSNTDLGDQCAIVDDCQEIDGLTLSGCTGAPRKCRYKDANGNQVTPSTTTTSGISSNGVRVRMISPKERNVQWYRLKGLCNANKWWGERVLNPLIKTLGSGLVGYDQPESNLSGECANCDTPLADFPPATGNDGNLCGWERPEGDTGRCIHFRVDKSGYLAAIGGEKEAGEWAHLEYLMQEMQKMGMKWTTVFYSSDVELAKAAPLFKKYGITPIWRRNLKVDQLRSGEFARDVEIVKKAGLEPYFQIYNEPEIEREWKSGTPDQDVFVNNWISAAIEIYNAGGKPGLQVLDEENLQAVLDRINEIANTSNPSIKKLFNNMFFIPHLYANEREGGASGDGVLNYEPFANIFENTINFIPPFIIGEGGYLDKFSSSELGNKYKDIFEKLQKGKLPNYIFAYCPWIIESNIDEFRGPGWYNTLDGTNRTELIDKIKSMPQSPMVNSCKP